MIVRIFAISLLLLWTASDGDDDGRRGNEFYELQQYDLAVESYQRGLAALSEDAPRLLRYGLLNNLGAALLKSGNVEAAGEAFARALNAAPASSDVARSSYNAGNASFAGQELEAALDNYRESLLADPANEDAKFNYEFVKRQLQQQQQQPQQQQQQDDQQRDDQEDKQQGDQEQEGAEQNQEEQQDEQQEGGSEQEQEESPTEDDAQQPQEQQQRSPQELSEEQARQILQALQNEEEQLLRQVQRPTSRPRQVEKDW